MSGEPVAPPGLMNPTLREYLELRLDYERSLVAQKFEALDTALVLQRAINEKALISQAAEYERRLTVLNHAHEAAVKEQARTLSREMFEQWRIDHDKWRESVNRSLTTLQTRAVTWSAAVGLFFTVLSLLFKWRP